MKVLYRQYCTTVNFITETEHLCMLISYEKSRLNKKLFISELVDFLKINLTEEKIN